MATEFLMPKLGLTMEQGTIVEWLIADGDTVAAGAPVLRIETDKTETDVEAVGAGRLHVVGQVGDTFACGERIGWILADGELPPSSTAGSATAASAAPATPTATAAAAAPTTSTTLTAPPTGPAAAVPTAAVGAGGRLLASPLAKRLAAERSIDLRFVRGTGPDGRIVAADLDGVAATATAAAVVPPAVVPSSANAAPSRPATAAARQLADLLGVDVAVVPVDPVDGYVTREAVARHVRSLLAAAAGPAPAVAAPTAAPSAQQQAPVLVPATQTPTSTIRLSGMRGTIARRMSESLSQMAQLTLFMDANLDAVVADRRRRAESGKAPSYTDYVIAAAARALLKHPVANSQITADGVALLPTVHVGMAVALDGGLIVPVISDTASRDLASLSAETSRLAEAARTSTLKLADLEGGTFSVSTLGMFGVDGFTPVINPPNTCILGVGRLRDDLVLDSDTGVVSTTKRLTLSLTWDHRAFDGAPAAEFCQSIVTLLSDPAALDQAAQ
jgi:pyruvate dehydrogenase E2 component (dihydrolipoamide acetyltransferase)